MKSLRGLQRVLMRGNLFIKGKVFCFFHYRTKNLKEVRIELIRVYLKEYQVPKAVFLL